ncbi:PAS domain-containing protein [bacterium]|nr:PAS domain-containing protein [bacterium]
MSSDSGQHNSIDLGRGQSQLPDWTTIELRNGSAPGKRAILWVLLSLILAILLYGAGLIGQPNLDVWNGPNPAFISFLETVDVFVGFVIGGLLLLNRRLHRGTIFWVPLTYGILSMSILDAFQTLLPAGKSSTLLYLVASLAGGLIYALVWYRPQASERQKTVARSLAFVVVMTGVVALLRPSAVPEVFNSQALSRWTMLSMSAGGVLTILASLRLGYQYYRDRRRDDILFAAHCLLLGSSEVIYIQSSEMADTWLLGHLLRFGAFFVLLGYTIDTMWSLQDEVICHHLNLQRSAIEARRRAEEAIEEHLAWRDIINLYTLISVTDKSGKIVDVNEGFCKLSGYTREELLGQNHRIVNSGYHPRAFWIEMWKSLVSGKAWRGEVCNRAKDGTLYWVDSINVPQTDPKGNITGYVSLRFDITQRVSVQAEVEEARSQLAEHQDRFERAVRGTSDGLWDLYPGTNVAWFSNQFKWLLGFEPEEFDKLNMDLQAFIDRIHPDDVGATLEALDRHLKEGERYDVQFRLRQKSDEYCWFRSRGLATRDEKGNPIRMAGSIVNISDQKDAEEELRKTVAELQDAYKDAERLAIAATESSQQKSEFLANMSHEIRTPMTAILGFTELLLSEEGLDKAPPERRAAFDSIDRNGRHLMTVINDILDMSKIEAGRMTVERIPLEPRQLVEDVVMVLQERANNKGLELSLRYKTLMPEMIHSDPTRLRQILINLTGNAIKFTESGKVAIDVAYDPSEQVIEFGVIDTGIGMSPEQVELIAQFTAFTQASAGMTRQFGGTGLGLCISNSLAHLLGGSLTVESEQGVGSHFIVRVSTAPTISEPAENEGHSDQLDENTSQSSEQPTPPAAVKKEAVWDEAADPTPLAGVRVLVAEDGPDNQKLIQYFVEKAGAEVTMVENGKLAVKAALRSENDNDPYDVILMDMQMPLIDGYTATRQLRTLDYPRPIIALTAHAMTGDREKCLEAGCSDFTTKPLQRHELIEKIMQAARGPRCVGF